MYNITGHWYDKSPCIGLKAGLDPSLRAQIFLENVFSDTIWQGSIYVQNYRAVGTF